MPHGSAAQEGRPEEGGRQEGDGGAQARRRRAHQGRVAKLLVPWWERDPASLDIEVKKLENAGFRVSRETSLGRLVLRAENATEHYAVLYPAAPAVSNPIATTGTNSRLRMATRSDGISAIQRLREGGGVLVPERGLNGEVLLTPAWSRLAPKGPPFGTMRLGASRLGPNLAALAISFAGQEEIPSGSETFATAFRVPIKGLWCSGSVGDRDTTEDLVATIEGQLAVHHKISLPDLRARLRTDVGALAVEWKEIEAMLQWYFVMRGARGEPLLLGTHEITPGAVHLRSRGAGSLHNARVALVGCGSMGWAIALGLARAGIRYFTLYDADRVQAHNLSRLDTFLPWVGASKSAALAEHLQGIAPGITADARHCLVGEDIAALALMEDAPDLIIDAVGETDSTDPTNIAAVALGTPVIYVWVSNGILAARIIRVRPGETACYECVRQSGPAELPSLGFVPRGGEAASWEGQFCDIETVAARVVYLACNTLTALDNGARGYPDIQRRMLELDPDHAILEFRGLAPTLRTVRTERDPDCRVCGS